jgi:hypothetical protein
MNSLRARSDGDVIRALQHKIAERFAADLSVVLRRVNATHAGRAVDQVLDEIAAEVRRMGFEPNREALRPHAVLISKGLPGEGTSATDLAEQRPPQS